MSKLNSFLKLKFCNIFVKIEILKMSKSLKNNANYFAVDASNNFL